MKLKIFMMVILILKIGNLTYPLGWTQTNFPITTVVRSLYVEDNTLYAGTDSGVYFTEDNGINWTLTGLTNVSVNALESSGDYLFAGTNFGFYITSDNGTNWILRNIGLSNTYIRSLAVSGSILFAGTDGGLFYSNDIGSNWIKLTSGLPELGIFAISISGINIFAGTYGGGVFLSTDYGASWTEVNTGITNLNILSLASNSYNIFAGANPGSVFRSTNNGTNWNKLQNITGTIASFYFLGNNLFAGKYEGGVYLSTNNGSSWVNLGLSNQEVYSIVVLDTNLFVGTSNTLWRRPLSEVITSIKINHENTISDFYIFQNYPNPFNPSTSIQYAISSRQFVTLKVYDVLGNEIATLVNEEKPAGSYEVTFDSHSGNIRNLTSGIYFYQLKTDSFIQTKKMILLK